MNAHPGRITPSTIQRFRCDTPILAQDRDFVSVRSAFIRAKKHLRRYQAALRGIARHIDSLSRHFDAATVQGQALFQASLLRYRDQLTPWAEKSADAIVGEIETADVKSWRKLSAEIGRGIEREIVSAPIVPVMEALKREQVALIRSIPKDAAERVNKLVTEGISRGTRAETIADEIYKSGSVSRARADLIAVTETSRIATTLTQARAEHVGSSSYRWRTARDGSVREDHKILEGRVFKWSDPPVADRRTGARAHPGCIYRCRCYPEPLFDGD